MVVAGVIGSALQIATAFLLLTFSYVLLTASWNIRCRRFGWRLRYIGTWQYIDAREDRLRLPTPAPGVPLDLEDARTSFVLRPVRRLDGSRTW
jgi:hypothetical protein